MKTFSITHPTMGLVTYQDSKRYWWLLSIVMPAAQLLSLYVFLQTSLEWTLGLPMLFIYLVVPLLDSIIGSDTNNPPEAIVPQLESDTYYRYLSISINEEDPCFHKLFRNRAFYLLLQPY